MTKPVAFVFAHPDDETFLCAAFIRRLAEEGNPPVLLLATKGEAGGKNGAYVGATKEELAAIRVREMEEAARILGLRSVEHLGYPDGRLDTVDEAECVGRIAEFLNRHRSPAVVTFPENGGNGHPDHVAISKFATKAATSGLCPHVRRLYYTAAPAERPSGLSLDTEPIWAMKASALRAHESQILAIRRFFGDLDACPPARRHERLNLVWERGCERPHSVDAWLTEGLE